MVFTTTVMQNSGAYKTSIPKAIVQLLEMKKGDKINWNVEIKDNSATICIKKIENDL